jgi:radical SAM-linked protein
VRVRIRFSKLGKIRFTSHRDVARIWERALRKAGVQVAYTEGFSPHARLSFGLALPTGHESVAEYLDVEVRDLGGALDDLADRLTGSLPVGIDATAVGMIEPHAVSLQEAVVASSWRITLSGTTVDEARQLTAAALAAPSIVATRVRKGHEVVDDLRPGIEHLAVVSSESSETADPFHGPDEVVIEADLATRTRGIRPSELVAACYAGATESRVLRTHQWIERDGERCEPLAAGAPSSHAVGACA